MTTNVLSLNEATARLEAAYAAGEPEALRRAANDYVRSEARFNRQRALSKQDDLRYGPGGTFREGLGGGILNVGRRATGMLLPRSMEDAVAGSLGMLEEGRTLQDQIKEQKALDDRGGGAFQAGKFAGEVVATLPVGGAVGGLAKGAGAGLARRAGVNALEGGVTGAMTADDGATVGALVGGSMLPAGRLLGKTLSTLGSGIKRTADADTLIGLGAKLDLGQMNPGGKADRLIKAARSAPGGVGAGITAAREEALRPVIGNLASDMAGIARAPSDSARKGVDRALRSVEGDFDIVNKVAPTADQALSGRLHRVAQANAAHEARAGARGAEAAARSSLGSKGQLASARRMEADVRLDAARANPDVDPRTLVARGIRRAEAGVDEQRAARAIQEHSPRAFGQQGRDAARRAIGETDSPLMSAVSRDLDRFAKKGSYKVADEVQAKAREFTSILNKKNVSVADMKKAASDLKAEARAIRYKRHQKFTGRRNAEYLEAAADSMERQVKQAIREGGGDVSKYAMANRRYKRLMPLMEGVHATGSTPHGLVDPAKLERALQRSMSPRAWIGGGGGKLRRTVEALKRLDTQTEAGPMQASGIPSWPVRALQGMAGVPLSSKFVGKIARGDHATGRMLRKAASTKAGRRSLRAAQLAQHGLPGGVTGLTDNENREY